MRQLLVLALVTLSVLTGPLVGSAAAAQDFGPFSTYSSCQQSAGNREMHGWRITWQGCHYRDYQPYKPGYYYIAYRY